MCSVLELKRRKCFKKEGMPMSNAAKKLSKNRTKYRPYNPRIYQLEIIITL